jgi:hypothetical protein
MRAGGALCYPRMDERILCKASCTINLTYSREIFIAINMLLSDRKSRSSSFDIFVNVSTFLKSSFPYDSQIPIPWEAWGPQNTRWFERDEKHSLHGQRAVDAVPCEHESDGEDEASKRWRLRVRDFNPHAVRRSAQGQIEKGWKCRAVTTPSTISTTFTEGAYKKDIISSLPYTEVISEETFCADVVLMDGSRLFIPKVSGR